MMEVLLQFFFHGRKTFLQKMTPARSLLPLLALHAMLLWHAIDADVLRLNSTEHSALMAVFIHTRCRLPWCQRFQQTEACRGGVLCRNTGSAYNVIMLYGRRSGGAGQSF